MSLQDRIESLKAKHAALESALEFESKRPVPDNTQVMDIKRQKLRIKDELSRMAMPAH